MPGELWANSSSYQMDFTMVPDLKQFSGAKGKLFQEIFGGAPGWNTVCLLDVLCFRPLQHRSDVILWVSDLLHLDLRCKKIQSDKIKPLGIPNEKTVEAILPLLSVRCQTRCRRRGRQRQGSRSGICVSLV